jgi:hypothetical protein
MTDFPSLSSNTGEKDRMVYVRPVQTADLPEEIRVHTGGIDQLYAIHAASGERLALVSNRRHAFVVARQHEFSPVSVH